MVRIARSSNFVLELWRIETVFFCVYFNKYEIFIFTNVYISNFNGSKWIRGSWYDLCILIKNRVTIMEKITKRFFITRKVYYIKIEQKVLINIRFDKKWYLSRNFYNCYITKYANNMFSSIISSNNSPSVWKYF